MKILTCILLFFIACFWGMFASAQQMWDYTGSVLVGTSNSSTQYPGQSAPLPQYSPITGYFTVAQSLGDNLNNVLITPATFDMTEGATSVVFVNGQNQGALQSYDSLYVSTNANGQIVGWSMNFGAGAQSASNPFYFNATSSQSGDSTNGYTGSFGCCSTSWTASNNTAGVWVDPPVSASAPEIDPASAAAGLLLLIGGLAVARGRRHSRIHDLI
jgi:hypothetical protein